MRPTVSLSRFALIAMICLVLGGCGGGGPEPSTEAAPVPGGEQTQQGPATSARLNQDGWKALKDFGRLLHQIGGRSRSVQQGRRMYENQGACLGLAGQGPQALAIRGACVDDFAVGRSVVDVHNCVTGDGDRRIVNRRKCLQVAFRTAADAAQEAAASTRQVADTLKPGRCQTVFVTWAEDNDRMARVIAAASSELRRLGRQAPLDPAIEAFEKSAIRTGFGGQKRLQTLCRPAKS